MMLFVTGFAVGAAFMTFVMASIHFATDSRGGNKP
jgi:hypothetical protein